MLVAVNLLIYIYSGSIWGITEGFILPDLQQINSPAVQALFVNLGVILGSFYSIKNSGNFRLRGVCGLKRGILVFAGGMMMGYGARLAGGCNIKAMLNGFSTFSLHGLIFAPAVIAGAYLGSRLSRKLYG